MKKRVELKVKCPSCKGTGLFSGMGEGPGAAVVCSKCSGTGCYLFRYEYEDFKARVPRQDVKRVYQTNPGIKIGEGNGYRLEDFGGMPFSDWEGGKPFPPGSENRRFTCPAWWYQSANYDLKPEWDECLAIGSFSSCPYFGRKEKCWERWDTDPDIAEKRRGEKR